MRAIDADAYIKYINTALKDALNGATSPTIIMSCMTIVKAVEADMRNENITPTIESSEELSIMCKDCKWCEERNDSLFKIPYLLCKNWNEETDALGFCYKAERRTNG